MPFSEKFKGDLLRWFTKVYNCREPNSGADVAYSDSDGVKLLIAGSRAASPHVPLSEKWIPPLCSFLLPSFYLCNKPGEKVCGRNTGERGRADFTGYIINC